MNKIIIYTNSENKLCIVMPAPNCGLSMEEIAQKDIPAGIQYTIIDADALPKDIIFRDAWEEDKNTNSVVVNIDIAKDITHTIRRKIRAKEFEPYDKIIALQIPGNDAAEAEAKRAEIRVKFEAIQQSIDSASIVADLKQVVDQLTL